MKSSTGLLLLFLGLLATCASMPSASKKEKPGRCPSPHPPPGRVTHCGLLCSSDYNCPGIQKCCRYGCSASCTNPLRA
ncbi:nawaprin [Anolis carolinensis]|uniref:nawaprin n=1 Tax=Anolis carolinensis TaxID=28377 RepID=UPI0004625315|nr:PREDICTED: nawaprin [Anolis carolinensis]|eukprot:XP_008122359.1 PREDICTED: nawaprin [Anolis carolinensis]